MGGSYIFLPHTADTAIEVHADTLAELIELAATGMFATTYDAGEMEPERWVTVTAEGNRLDEMLVDVLADLLYLSEVEDVVPCHIRVDAISPRELGIAAGVFPADPSMLVGPPIKAVTYHDLEVEELPDGSWRAQIVFAV